MPKITHKNYFTPANNRGLSASKIKDFLKSPDYFYRKHVLKDPIFHNKTKKAFIIGSAIDCWITFSKQTFKRRYKRVKRRSKITTTKYIELTESEYDEVSNICLSYEKSKISKELKKFERQVVLTHKQKIGKHFDYLCGMLDFLYIGKKKAVIVDLKSSQTIDKRRYNYLAEDYGYYISAYMYKELVLWTFPQIEKVDFYHLVLHKDPDKIYNSRLFLLNEKKIDSQAIIVEDVIDALNSNSKKMFIKEEVSFRKAIKL